MRLITNTILETGYPQHFWILLILIRFKTVLLEVLTIT